MEFSPDSQYILVVQSKRGLVEAKSLTDQEWVCKIEDSAFGLAHAIWFFF